MTDGGPPRSTGNASSSLERDALESPSSGRTETTLGQRINAALRSLVEWTAVAVGALAVALLIKAFLMQAFFIPSGSMQNTLDINDRVLVYKLSYATGEVDRGDIVVFDRPARARGPIDEFIKRVIATPGETITFADGAVYIDGRRLEEPYVGGADTASRAMLIDAEGCINPPASDTCTLAEGFYFMMGDNRRNSTDSRDFGPVHEDSIIGRAFLKVWPLDDVGLL